MRHLRAAAETRPSVRTTVDGDGVKDGSDVTSFSRGAADQQTTGNVFPILCRADSDGSNFN
jgi:hypothetical protein